MSGYAIANPTYDPLVFGVASNTFTVSIALPTLQRMLARALARLRRGLECRRRRFVSSFAFLREPIVGLRCGKPTYTGALELRSGVGWAKRSVPIFQAIGVSPWWARY